VSESLSTVASEAEISVASQEFSGAPTPTKAELRPQLHDNTNTPPKFNPKAAEFHPQPHYNTGEATDYFQPRLPTPQYNHFAQAMATALPPNSGPPPQPNATYVSLHPDTYLPLSLSPLTNP
jgi:hypothetical protein